MRSNQTLEALRKIHFKSNYEQLYFLKFQDLISDLNDFVSVSRKSMIMLLGPRGSQRLFRPFKITRDLFGLFRSRGMNCWSDLVFCFFFWF